MRWHLGSLYNEALTQKEENYYGIPYLFSFILARSGWRRVPWEGQVFCTKVTKVCVLPHALCYLVEVPFLILLGAASTVKMLWIFFCFIFCLAGSVRGEATWLFDVPSCAVCVTNNHYLPECKLTI
jgi:hypothetical protein